MTTLPVYFASLSSAARLRLILGTASIVVLTGLALWWALLPRQQLLFGNLAEGDAAEIVSALEEWKVPFEIGDGGTSISVASDDVYTTRMKLVSAGVPKGGHVGFELFNDADFGVTEFAQRVNYQRALQGEIERTIASIPGVDSARVHLTIQRPGLFVAEREISKASVTLAMRPGAVVTRAQVDGIQGLVASAVEGLSPGAVAVLGPDGDLLSQGAGGDASGRLGDRHDEQSGQEERLRVRLETLLKQVLHDGQFSVSVDVQLNFDTVREVNERLIAQGDGGNGLLTRKRINSTGAADGQAPRDQNQEEIEYAHGTARQEISRALGRIERISVAVILPPELDEFEVERIRSLVSAAAGVSTERGDRVEVSRLSGDRGAVSETIPTSAEDVGAVDTRLPEGALAPSGQLPGWQKLLLLVVLGVLLGAIGMAATRSKPRRLNAQEREAVLARLRGWLADGEARS